MADEAEEGVAVMLPRSACVLAVDAVVG